jgi:hypothetical protein
MKKSSKFMLLIATALFLSFGLANSGAAAPFDWYMSITNEADLVTGEYFYLDVYFSNTDNGSPTVGNDGLDNLNCYFLDLGYNTDMMDFVQATYIDHYVSDGGPFPTQVFDGGLIPSQPIENPDGYLRDIMGSEPLGVPRVFYPDDQIDANSTGVTNAPYNHLARLWFTASVTGHYDDLDVQWYAPDRDSLIRVDMLVYDVEKGHQFITWEEDGVVKCTYDPVPVPAAVWLLGSGLLGLIGIRRRSN